MTATASTSSRMPSSSRKLSNVEAVCSGDEFFFFAFIETPESTAKMTRPPRGRDEISPARRERRRCRKCRVRVRPPFRAPFKGRQMRDAVFSRPYGARSHVVAYPALRAGLNSVVAARLVHLQHQRSNPRMRLTRPPRAHIVSASCTPPDLAPALATATGSRVAARVLRACQPDVRHTSSATRSRDLSRIAAFHLS